MRTTAKSDKVKIALAILVILLSGITLRYFSQGDSTVTAPKTTMSQSRQEAEAAAALGDKFSQQGDFASAAQQFEKSLSLHKDRDNQFILASVYLRAGKKDLAIAKFQELAKGTDDNAKIARDTIRDISKK